MVYITTIITLEYHQLNFNELFFRLTGRCRSIKIHHSEPMRDIVGHLSSGHKNQIHWQIDGMETFGFGRTHQQRCYFTSIPQCVFVIQ